MENMLVSKGINIIFNIDIFHDNIKEWRCLPGDENNLARFNMHLD